MGGEEKLSYLVSNDVWAVDPRGLDKLEEVDDTL